MSASNLNDGVSQVKFDRVAIHFSDATDCIDYLSRKVIRVCGSDQMFIFERSLSAIFKS